MSEELLAQLEKTEKERDLWQTKSFELAAYAQHWLNVAEKHQKELDQRRNFAYWIFRGYGFANIFAGFVPVIGPFLAQKAYEFVAGMLMKQILKEGAEEYGKRKNPKSPPVS